MAITPTGAIYKTLNFDGQSSGTYGVYITGEAVYNAPERAVEMIEIPGRNGAFALDEGRFENIEVSYPAGIFADNEADFAEAISDFRNYLCSRSGYCRLTDDYNSDEYRLAVYKSGLEVSPSLLRAGEFTITFECKPQRFLTSGEAAIPVLSGDTVTNPTLFPSNPLLTVDGSGAIMINGKEIDIYGVYLGTVVLAAQNNNYTTTQETIFANDKYNPGDTISMQGYISGSNGTYISGHFTLYQPYDYWTSDPMTATDSNAKFHTISSSTGVSPGSTSKGFNVRVDTLTFTAGTSSTITNISSMSGRLNNINYTGTLTTTITYTPNYTPGYDRILVTMNATQTGLDGITSSLMCRGEVSVNSTVLLDNDDVYIDLDLGEAYSIIGGEVVPLNDQVEIPAELPTLDPGSNTITFDNTINSLDITPRWWKV